MTSNKNQDKPLIDNNNVNITYLCLNFGSTEHDYQVHRFL